MTFLGRVAPVAPVLERAEVVVVPSFGEGFGMVALEAMERGRPVIASDVGGLPEIVDDGRTGLLVPPGDVEALAGAIVELASDPARAAAMGAAGRARALDEFSQERCTERIEALYGAALAAAGERRSAGAPRRARARTPRAARARSPTARGSGPSRRTPSPSSVLKPSSERGERDEPARREERAPERERVEREHERRLDRSLRQVGERPAAPASSAVTLRNGDQSIPTACTASRAFSPGWSRQKSSTWSR